MTESSILTVTNLKASYSQKQVLHGLNLDVVKNDIYGLIGLNGAGKTTLIKIILGLKDQDEGDISLFGLDRMNARAKADIAYLPERFDPPWFLRGEEFIIFSAKLYGRKVDRQEIQNLCQRLALDPTFMNKKVQTYSKGMRQKLGLIATILTGSQLLILDEPMSGLDPLARALVKDVIDDVKQQGRTIVLSSHILADMDEICNRVSVIHDGMIHFTGTPAGFKEAMSESTLEKAFLNIVKPKQTVAA